MPVDLALQVIRERLEGNKELHTRTCLAVEDIMDLLKFIVTTTYFSFRAVIYQQKFGAAMVSPVSPLLANLFMEWLEKQDIATAPVECKPKLWKWYVDDVLELIKRGQVRNLTDHINSIDPAGNIKFTYEEEEDKQILFLDTLLVRREDGSVKLLVYRKKTHTDQYLNFSSHHPLKHKPAVIRTLLERCYSIVSEEDDQKKEHVQRCSISVATLSGPLTRSNGISWRNHGRYGILGFNVPLNTV